MIFEAGGQYELSYLRPCSECRQIRFVSHCHLQVIRSDLLCPDITALYQPICMGCRGNDWWCSFTIRKYDNCKNVEIRYIVAIQTLAWSSRSAELSLWNRAISINVTMFRAWQASLCSERFGTVHKAVTGGSMLSLGHFMIRGGVHFIYLFFCQALWPSSTLSYPSRNSIQAPSICEVMLRFPI